MRKLRFCHQELLKLQDEFRRFDRANHRRIEERLRFVANVMANMESQLPGFRRTLRTERGLMLKAEIETLHELLWEQLRRSSLKIDWARTIDVIVAILRLFGVHVMARPALPAWSDAS